MEKISIKTSAVNIFKTANHTTKEAKHSNPFGLSFKGNVLQADVFSSSKVRTHEETGVMGKIAERSRAVKSAIVGGINNFNTELSTRFNNGINRIVSFGRKIGENTRAMWQKANETNIVLDFNGLGESIKHIANMDIKDIIMRKDEYSVKELSKHPVSELETMFRAELEGIKG